MNIIARTYDTYCVVDNVGTEDVDGVSTISELKNRFIRFA